ncbi:DUF1002 domain-containing protein [Eremococcus coleocola]|uniref:DUF1002 domain-containing protein n=1 Tax=Eremococcus coleocola ACS-139-V-Col8 TaxID=908337 RepID=E4KPI2_9LACT|nr:DUF1002 domain-containing protein [Eremococcus coleocola]EFR31295.1 hypothetical protein HMPREF9257_1470 [Eremococcus coleocola ACS-139-V-Col8]
MQAKKFSLVIAASLLFGQFVPVDAISNQQAGQPIVSLGASLDPTAQEQTKGILGASAAPADNILYVDGPTINKYLQDGSNEATQVFSSAYIMPQAPGSGVRVEIVTPENIQKVSRDTYQNAAITAGAKDVLVRIATVQPVTGEGALAGVYALMEATGAKLDQASVKVAEKEIQVIQNVQANTQISNVEINQVITQLKQEITVNLVDGKDLDVNALVDKLLADKQIQMDDADKENIIGLLKEYAQTETAKNKDTVQQLDVNLAGDWQSILEEMPAEASQSLEEILAKGNPDFSDTNKYHPVIQATADALMAAINDGSIADSNVYNDTFIIEAMKPDLNADEKAALNQIRTTYVEARMAAGEEVGASLKDKLLAGLAEVNRLKIEDPASYNDIMLIGLTSGYMPQSLDYDFDDLNSDDQVNTYMAYPYLVEKLNEDNVFNRFSVNKESKEVTILQNLNGLSAGALESISSGKMINGVALENHFELLPVPELPESDSAASDDSQSSESSEDESQESGQSQAFSQDQALTAVLNQTGLTGVSLDVASQDETDGSWIISIIFDDDQRSAGVYHVHNDGTIEVVQEALAPEGQE